MQPLTLPPSDLQVLTTICNQQLAGTPVKTWDVEQLEFARLRTCGLVTATRTNQLYGTWAGWQIARPDIARAAADLIAQIQAQCRAGEVPDLSPEDLALLQIAPMIGTRRLVDGEHNPKLNTRAFASFDLNQLWAPSPCPSHALPTLYFYGVREFSRVHPSPETQIQGVDLQGSTFRDCNLSNLDLSRICLDDCTFENCSFTGTILRDASLRRAKFIGGDCLARDLSGANLDDVEFSNQARIHWPSISTHATWESLQVDGQRYTRTPLLAFENRPLGWAIIFKGEELGSLPLQSIPVLAGLVRHPNQLVHALDAETWKVRPDHPAHTAPPLPSELRGLLEEARLPTAPQNLDDKQRWRLAAIARRLILLDEIADSDEAATLVDERDVLREYVEEQFAAPKPSLPQQGPVKRAVARVTAGLSEFSPAMRKSSPELADIVDESLVRQEFCCWRDPDPADQENSATKPETG